jgi:hypothetical protein
VESFVQAIDAEAIIDNATRGLFTDPSWLSGVRRGFTKEIKTGFGLRFLALLESGSYVKLLRLKTNEGGAQALLRFDYGDLGAGYMDFYLLRSERGDVRIVDWYDFGMGQRYTETLKQLIGMSAPTPTLLGTIFDITSKRKKTADIIQEIIDLKVQKKNKELVDKILQLDNTYRRSRVLCLIAVQSASQSDDIELYRRAMANLEHYHGDEEKLFFILLDYYFLEKKYDDLLSHLDIVQAMLSVDDANLEVIRANACNYKGDLKCALAAARRATVLEPEYEYGYWALFASQVELGDYVGGVKTARMLEENFGRYMDPVTLSEIKGSNNFIQSEVYRQWRNEG